jgi:hypothetical protein
MSPPRDEPRRFSLGRAILFGVLAWLVWMLMGWVYNAFFMSEEDHIRQVLQGAVDGANDRSPRHVTRIMTQNFKAHGYGKDEVHQACVVLLMQHYRAVKFELIPQPVPVQLDPANRKRATAVFHISGMGKPDEAGEWQDVNLEIGRYLGEKPVDLKAVFVKTDEGWMMESIDLDKK